MVTVSLGVTAEPHLTSDCSVFSMLACWFWYFEIYSLGSRGGNSRSVDLHKQENDAVCPSDESRIATQPKTSAKGHTEGRRWEGRGVPGIGKEIRGSEWMSGKAGGHRQMYRDGLFSLFSQERALGLKEEVWTSSGHCTPAPWEGLTPLTEA